MFISLQVSATVSARGWLLGVDVLVPPWGFRKSNSAPQSRLQVSLPTKPSHLPKFPFLKNICVKTAFEQTRLGTGGPFKKRTYIKSGIMHDGNSNTEKTEKLSFFPPQFQGYPGLYRCCFQSPPQKQHNKDWDVSWNYLKGFTTEWSGLSIWRVKEKKGQHDARNLAWVDNESPLQKRQRIETALETASVLNMWTYKCVKGGPHLLYKWAFKYIGNEKSMNRLDL